MKSFLVVSALLCFVALSSAAEETTEKFVNYDVYKIESRLFTDGVLTVRTGLMNLTDMPRISLWSDSAGQKWRLESSKLYTAFQLRPTSYESFVLEQDETNTFLKWVASFTRLGHHKLWYLNDAGNGYTQIKNKQHETCLSALVLDQPIEAVPCTNGDDQQFKFVKL